MADSQENSAGEQDDISFLRTGDVVCLTCIAPSKETGTGSAERVALAAEGFGNRLCYLENVSDRNVPPDHATSMFYIHQALSVRALREMMSCDTPGTAGSSSSHRTLLYGHAVQLRHVLSTMYLTCLSTSSATDKLAFDVGLCESDSSESCWWTIHPASKQRSEGEKVRVGDDIILVSVATERYLHMSYSKGMTVIAAFHQTLWSVTPNSSGSVRNRNLGYVFGNDVLRLYHGNDECLTIPETWSDHPQQNIVIYESGKSCSQARSLWRPELLHGKWQGSLIGWEQVFRIRHVTSGRFLAITADSQVSLVHKDKATFESTAFITVPSKDVKRTSFEEKEEEGMGMPALKYGETVTFLQHLQTGLWVSCQTTAVTKKNVGKVEEKKAVAVEEARMDDCFVLFKAQGEEAQSARVIRKSSQILNRFLKGLEGLQFEGRDSYQWKRANLLETVKLMEDLIEYFVQPTEEDLDFETMQNRLRALRNRQDLFQEEGVLNMIIDTIDQLSSVESTGEFSEVMKETGSREWEQISTYLYLLVAAMIKGNHSNCTQFASAQRLDWLFNRLSNPQAAEGILDVLYCILTESPEALNLINETHVKSVISLLEKLAEIQRYWTYCQPCARATAWQ
uniref:MIR domain-containing protein n=1 Tax=Trichuris muris TaxID=70415 RepID=A0A5S6Q0N4_TRIMR